MEPVRIDDLKAKVRANIDKIIGGAIDDLTDIWLEMFSEETTHENLIKLVDHAKTFMDEICDETANRKEVIQDTIQQLRAEQLRLQILLQCRPSPQKSMPAIDADTPLFNHQVLLDRQIQELRDQLAARHAQIQLLCDREQALCSVLCEPTRGLPLEPLPSAADLDAFERLLAELDAERGQRTARMAELRSSIQQLCASLELELPHDVRGQLVRMPNAPLSTANLGKLADFERQLQQTRETIRTEIVDLQHRLRKLYDSLEAAGVDAATSDSERNALLLSDADGLRYTKTNAARMRTEIDRLRRIERQNIQKLVENVRREIECLWELTRRSDRERARFALFTSDEYSDDLLTLHKLELGDLRAFYEENAELFNLVQDHSTLWERLLALEAKEKEPGRYKNRGGQLLQEEKERRTISTKLPRISAEIERLNDEYKERNEGKPITIWGRPVDEHIMEMFDMRRNTREQEMSARKATATPSRNGLGGGATPLATSRAAATGGASAQRTMLTSMAATGRTPMSGTRGAVGGASLKRMASVTNINSTSTTKKLRIHTAAGQTLAGITPAKPLKRNILSELAPQGGTNTTATSRSVSKKVLTSSTTIRSTTAATPSKLTPHRFVRPAPKAATSAAGSAAAGGPMNGGSRNVVISTLTTSNANRRRSRRKSKNKSSSSIPRVLVTDCSTSHTDESYMMFEERVQSNSRSSVLPADAVPVARTTKLTNSSTAAGRTPAKIQPSTGRRRSRPSVAVMASPSRKRSPSPMSKMSAPLPFLY